MPHRLNKAVLNHSLLAPGFLPGNTYIALQTSARRPGGCLPSARASNCSRPPCQCWMMHLCSTCSTALLVYCCSCCGSCCALCCSVCGNNACELGETCTTVGCVDGCARDCGAWGVTIPCPQPSLASGYPALPCANRGVCEPRTGSCACFVGYTGPGCTLCDRLYEARTVFGLHLCVRSPPATCEVCGFNWVARGSPLGMGPGCYYCYCCCTCNCRACIHTIPHESTVGERMHACCGLFRPSYQRQRCSVGVVGGLHRSHVRKEACKGVRGCERSVFCAKALCC